jgi:TetR/AcrR family transcriptional regulator, cholesterol catabolism regulator
MKVIEIDERIIEGSQELFYKQGIRGITMDDIAKHLSMSKKTIYQHFNDKDSIVLRCCALELEKRDISFHKIAENAPDAIIELMNIMSDMSDMFSRINPVLFYDLQKHHPHSWKLMSDFKEKKILKMVEENLVRGIQEGLYRKDINILVLSRLRVYAVDMGFNPELFPPIKFNIKDVQLALLDHFMHGITTIKGHKLINKYRQVIEED